MMTSLAALQTSSGQVTMSGDQEDLPVTEVEEEEGEDRGYQPPPEKSIDQLLQADQVA